MESLEVPAQKLSGLKGHLSTLISIQGSFEVTSWPVRSFEVSAQKNLDLLKDPLKFPESFTVIILNLPAAFYFFEFGSTSL